MKEENIRSLESLSLYCHIGGMITIGLSLFIIFIDLSHGHFGHIQVGLFICITGYSLVKISSKLENILREEKTAQIKY